MESPASPTATSSSAAGFTRVVDKGGATGVAYSVPVSNDGNYGQQPHGPGWNQWPGNPGHPQQTGYPPQQSWVPQAPPPRKKKSHLAPLIAGGVGLAVIAAVATGVLLNRDAETPQPTSTPTPTPTVKAPGPGDYDTVIQYLEGQDFTCTEEGTPGIASSICTHFGAAPFMIAYVGAHESGGLGRLSLEVQEEARASTSKAVSDHLIGQFATPEAAKDIKASIASAAAPGYTRDSKSGEVRFRGNARGSVVMWMEDWVPDSVEPQVLTVSDTELDEMLSANGYACEASGVTQQCRKSASDVDYLLVHQQENGKGLSRLSLRTTSAKPGLARPAFQAEAKKILGALPDGQGAAIIDWMGKQDEKSGGMGFVDGRLVDYYPRSSVQGKEAGSVYIWASCWTGVRTAC